MDIISFNEASTANSRIEKINANPDSDSGIVTQPSVIASGDSVTIPTGRMAVLPNLQVDGELTIDGEVFVPSGTTVGDLDAQIALKADKATTYTKTEVDDIADTKITLTEANSYDLGVGQTWQNVTASRSFEVTYTNTTGKPIIVMINAGALNPTGAYYSFLIDGNILVYSSQVATAGYSPSTTSVVIPNEATYRITLPNGATDNNRKWIELR